MFLSNELLLQKRQDLPSVCPRVIHLSIFSLSHLVTSSQLGNWRLFSGSLRRVNIRWLGGGRLFHPLTLHRLYKDCKGPQEKALGFQVALLTGRRIFVLRILSPVEQANTGNMETDPDKQFMSTPFSSPFLLIIISSHGY